MFEKFNYEVPKLSVDKECLVSKTFVLTLAN